MLILLNIQSMFIRAFSKTTFLKIYINMYIPYLRDCLRSYKAFFNFSTCQSFNSITTGAHLSSPCLPFHLSHPCLLFWWPQAPPPSHPGPSSGISWANIISDGQKVDLQEPPHIWGGIISNVSKISPLLQLQSTMIFDSMPRTACRHLLMQNFWARLFLSTRRSLR